MRPLFFESAAPPHCLASGVIIGNGISVSEKVRSKGLASKGGDEGRTAPISVKHSPKKGQRKGQKTKTKHLINSECQEGQQPP